VRNSDNWFGLALNDTTLRNDAFAVLFNYTISSSTFSETLLHVLSVTNGLPLVTRKRRVVTRSAIQRVLWERCLRTIRTYVHTYVREFNYPRLTGTYDVYGTTCPRAIVSRANLWGSWTSVVGPAVTIKVVKSRTNSLVTLIQCNVAR